jgi:AcrR family transcriptional regulator
LFQRNVVFKKCFHSFATRKFRIPPMDNKERILVAAYELFFRYGIKSVTMDDIAKHLSMSKKTIYLYFRDKDEVVHTLMERSLQKDQEDFHRIAQEAGNVVEEVFEMMKKMNDIFSTINPNIFYDLRKYHPQTWELFHKFKSEFIITMVEATLEKGKKDGFVRSDINSKLLAKLRGEEIEMGFNPALFPPDKFRILDVQIALVEHFLYGICTLKGHKLINKHKQIVEEE